MTTYFNIFFTINFQIFGTVKIMAVKSDDKHTRSSIHDVSTSYDDKEDDDDYHDDEAIDDQIYIQGVLQNI